MLWLKALHVIFMVTWFAGMFYLPRLFVYHAMNEDPATSATLKVMERKLMVMMHIGALMTWSFGLALIIRMPQLLDYGWLQVKLVLVLLLTGYHIWCYRLVGKFAADANTRDHRWYRWFNEIPTVFLFAVIILTVLKPF